MVDWRKVVRDCREIRERIAAVRAELLDSDIDQLSACQVARANLLASMCGVDNAAQKARAELRRAGVIDLGEAADA